MMKTIDVGLLILLVIFIAGAFIRLYPTILYDKPLKYDSYYHARVAELVKTTGSTPSEEPWPEGGRPHFYPPLYHVSLAAISSISGSSVLDVIKFFLPIISAILILAVFWLAYSYRNMNTALLTVFLVAFNPFILNASYDSPELIGLLLLCFSVFLLLKERPYLAGIFLGVGLLFNIFFAVITFTAISVFLIYKKKYSVVPKFAAIPAVAALLWYLPKLGDLQHLDFSIGPNFVAQSLTPWMLFLTPAIVVSILILIVLVKFAPKVNIREKLDDYRSFWTVWVIFFTFMFFTFVLTPIFYPWRMLLYLSLGFSFLLADVLVNTKFKHKLIAPIFIAFFIIVSVATSTFLVTSNTLRPPLDDNEYLMLSWIESQVPKGSTILADNVVCSNIQTLTNKTCLLDINFESIPNKQSWQDFQNFFASLDVTRSDTYNLFRKYSIDYIIFASKYTNRTNTELFADKVYASWVCDSGGKNCLRDAAAYRFNG